MNAAGTAGSQSHGDREANPGELDTDSEAMQIDSRPVQIGMYNLYLA